MLNIFCVKIGSKYSHTYVNRLFEMCSKHVSIPFDFYCYTDNTAGLTSSVKPIPHIEFNLSPIVYNKLFLFSKTIADSVDHKRQCCFFDLDIVIKSNIDVLFDKTYSKPHVISSSWKEFIFTDIGWPLFDHKINSSCILWKFPDAHYVWDHFIKAPQLYMSRYHRGMDAYLAYEHNIIGGLPEQLFYSYLYGISLKEKRVYPTIEHELNVMKKTPIVLFNGPTNDADVERFIESGYTLRFDPADLSAKYQGV